MPTIFVANIGRNTTDLEFFQSSSFQALLSQYSVPVIELEIFDLELKRVIDGRNPERKLLTWGEARDNPDFSILGQQEIQTYLEDFYGQLDRAERLADSAFYQRLLSPDANGKETEARSKSILKRNFRDGQVFSWIVETALMRVELAELMGKLAQTDSQLALHPEHLKSSLNLVLKPYLEEVGRVRMASHELTKEIRAAAAIDASLAESGWRGIGAGQSAAGGTESSGDPAV